MQISRSDVSGHHVTSQSAACYLDYKSAVFLRNFAGAYGTDVPRYLLAPEVAVLLSKMPDLKKQLYRHPVEHLRTAQRDPAADPG
ncbi:hypothetical protein ACQPT2_06790 [Erwinia amylovora]